MQCPRCGLQNQPGITACARCGLPVPKAPSGQQTTGPMNPAGPRAPSPAPPDQPGYGQGTSGQGPYPPGQYGGTAAPGPGQQGRGQPPSNGPQGYPPQRQVYPQQPAPPQHQGYPQQPGYPAQQPGYPAQQPGHRAAPTPGSGWPVATHSAAAARRDSGALATVVALSLGALLALTYAVWAFTARRGIFADFSNGTTVTTDDAKSSDNLDTVLLVVAGLLVVVALALWVMRKVNGKTAGGALDLAGLVVTGVGVVVVLVGLFLSSQISDGADQAAQGDRGVTATLVTGSGFLIVAIGLVIGILAVRGTKDPAPQVYGQPAADHPSW